MSEMDAKSLFSTAEEWTATEFRDAANKDIFEKIKNNISIIINKESILFNIDFNIDVKEAFKPQATVLFSYLGKKPQTICHFAGLHPAIVRVKSKGAYKNIAYLAPVRRLAGTEIIETPKVNKYELLPSNELELLKEIYQVVTESKMDVKNVALDVKDLIIHSRK